jgi:hypothetical protein
VEQYKMDFLNRMNLTLHTDGLNECVMVGNQSVRSEPVFYETIPRRIKFVFKK